MSKRFKPVIKHDVVTQTYTIRDEKGIVIQVPDVIIDNLDSRYKAERDTLKDDVLAWAVTCNNLEQENKKLKAECDKFEKILNKECECGYKLEGQLHDMTKQRDTLSDDLSWYKAKVSRLEREKERLKEIKQEKEQLEESFQYQLEKRLEYFNKYQQLKESRDWDYEYIVKVNEENKRLEDENEQLKKENEMIDEQFTDYIDETCGYLKLLSEFSQHIGNKPSSSTYKYFRAKLDGIGIKEGE